MSLIRKNGFLVIAALIFLCLSSALVAMKSPNFEFNDPVRQAIVANDAPIALMHLEELEQQSHQPTAHTKITMRIKGYCNLMVEKRCRNLLKEFVKRNDTYQKYITDSIITHLLTDSFDYYKSLIDNEILPSMVDPDIIVPLVKEAKQPDLIKLINHITLTIKDLSIKSSFVQLLEESFKNNFFAFAQELVKKYPTVMPIMACKDELLQTYALGKNESAVFFLLVHGARDSVPLSKWTDILWLTLSQYSQSAQAESLLDLLDIFKQLGIREYRRDPYGYTSQQLTHASVLLSSTSDLQYKIHTLGNVLKRFGSCLNLVKPPLTYSISPYNIPVNKRNNVNQTTLMWASLFGHTQVARYLLDNNAHVNARDYKKRTALFYAVRYGHYSVARLLLAHGAYISLKDRAGKTCLHHCQERNNPAMALLLACHLKLQDIRRCQPSLGVLENGFNLTALKDCFSTLS